MCSSKHLDRTRSGPGSEQIRRVNSIYDEINLQPQIIHFSLIVLTRRHMKIVLVIVVSNQV